MTAIENFRMMVRAVVDRTGGNEAHAARSLGIGRSTLRIWLDKDGSGMKRLPHQEHLKSVLETLDLTEGHLNWDGAQLDTALTRTGSTLRQLTGLFPTIGDRSFDGMLVGEVRFLLHLIF